MKELRSKLVAKNNKFAGIYTGKIGNVKTSKGRRKVALARAMFCSEIKKDVTYLEYRSIGTRWFFVDDISVWLRGQEPMTIEVEPSGEPLYFVDSRHQEAQESAP